MHVFVLLMASLNIVLNILSFNFVNLFILITGVAGAEAAQWDLSSRESHQYLDNVQPPHPHSHKQFSSPSIPPVFVFVFVFILA